MRDPGGWSIPSGVPEVVTSSAIGEQTKSGNVKGVAGGADKIGLALFATALGLFTAIPLVFSHVLFKEWIGRFEVKMKAASQKLVTLVDRMKQDPKFDLKTVPENELSDELRKLKPERRLEYVKQKAKEREGLAKMRGELQKRIDGLEAQLKLLEHLDQLFPINEFDWYYPVPRSFPPCLRRESASRDDDAFVSPACHCALKIAHLRRTN